MTMPNFLGLGAAKAGTSSIRQYLAAHPEIYLIRGEPRFFSCEGMDLDHNNPAHRQTITDLESYRALFEGVTHEKAIGEMSPSYLHNQDAAKRIKQYVPNVKLFAILRDPAARAFSHYMHTIKNGYEKITDFNKAIHAGEELVGDVVLHRYYMPFGYYYEQLQRYFQIFSRDQITIYLFEDLEDNPRTFMQDLYRFLEVDEHFLPDLSKKFNPSGSPKSRLLQRLLSRHHPIKSFLKNILSEKAKEKLRHMQLAIQKKNLNRIEFTDEMRKPVVELYKNDILKLQDLIGRDLSAWLK